MVFRPILNFSTTRLYNKCVSYVDYINGIFVTKTGENELNFLLLDNLGSINKEKVCYDFFKFDGFDDFCVDLKVIFGLLGYKFEDLQELLSLFNIDVKKYTELFNKVVSHLQSYGVTKIDVANISILHLMDESLVKSFYEEKLLLIEGLHQIAKSDNCFERLMKFYSGHLFEFMKCIKDLQAKPIKVDLSAIQKDDNHFNSIKRSVTNDGYAKLSFDIAKSKNGRLSTRRGSFNIFTLSKDLRKCIVAEEGFSLCHIDYVSFQPRIAIFLCDDEQFKNKFKNVSDLYSEFNGDRSDNKLALISWLFSNQPNEQFDKKMSSILTLRETIYNNNKLNNSRMENIYGRPLNLIREDKENVVFQNYISTTESDSLFEVFVEVSRLLNGMKSQIMFPFHDSIVFKIHEDETRLICDLSNLMSNFFVKERFFARFPVKVKTGKNFGEMRQYS